MNGAKRQGGLPKERKKESDKAWDVPELLQSDRKLDAANTAVILAAAEAWNVPPWGITLLGGKPYLNEVGLNGKWDEDERKVLEVKQEVIKEATKEDPRAKAKTWITMFYEEGYVGAQERILKAGGPLSKIILDELRKLYVSTYEGTGYASPETAKAIAYSYRWDYDKGKKVRYGDPLLDNINMLALTRSSNRCKRQIVKVRAPSSEEVSGTAKGETITLEPEEDAAKEDLENEIQQDELPLDS